MSFAKQRFNFFWSPFFVLVVAGLITVNSGRADESTAKPRPKLAVLVVFDQFRGDYPTRWEGVCSKGFTRVMRDGAWFENCHYPYATTVTAVGHASVSTGCLPAEHGVIGNEWFDRTRKKPKSIAAIEALDEKWRWHHPQNGVWDPPSTDVKYQSDAPRNISPDNLLCDSIGDRLTAATNGKAKVISLSYKARSAVLMGGRSKSHAVYWMNENTGKFVTSTYYDERDHEWAAAYNATNPADRYFDQIWKPVIPFETLDRLSGWKVPDSRFYTIKTTPNGIIYYGHPLGTPINGGLASLGDPKKYEGRSFYQALAATAFGNEVLLGFAEHTIREAGLGQGDSPDLLCVSFSSNDLVGHAYGPDSREVVEMTGRSDDVLDRLLACLDENIGTGNYRVVVTADHGICPFPEVANDGRGQYEFVGFDGKRSHSVTPGKHERTAGRYFYPDLCKSLRDTLTAAYRKKIPPALVDPKLGVDWLELEDDKQGIQVYLKSKTLSAVGVDAAEAAQVLVDDMRADVLKGTPQRWIGLYQAYTKHEMQTKQVAADLKHHEMFEQVLRSNFPERCGDVTLVLEPYWYISGSTGTTHGSPWAYDTHTPLMIYGGGVTPGKREAPASPLAAASILQQFLGIPIGANQTPVPAELNPEKVAWKFSPTMVRPFWEGETVEGESVLFVRDSDAETARAAVLFPIDEIIAVRNSAEDTVYENGRDFIWKPGSREIVLPAGSRIVSRKPQELRRPANSQKYKLTHRDGDGEIFFGARLEYAEMQTCITYRRAAGLWNHPVPKFDAQALPKTTAKLQKKEPVLLVVLGDSISAGANASAESKGAPFQPAYPELFRLALADRFGGKVELKNLSVGGTDSRWGNSQIDKVAEAHPDLVVLAFGMNDSAGRTGKEYGENMRQLLTGIREKSPEVEFILVATMLGNRDWTTLRQAAFAEFRGELAQLSGPGVALADLTTVWQGFLELKTDWDQTGNGVNHPNDFGHRVYTQVLFALLNPNGESDGKN